MSEANGNESTGIEFSAGSGETFPPPNNADTQAEQAKGLTEPDFDHHVRYETELLTAEFGPPDKYGVYARNPDASLDKPATRGEIEGRSL